MTSTHSSEIEKLIEPWLKEYLALGNYNVQQTNPLSLLTWDRFDLGAKLLFLDDLISNRTINYNLYAEHIKLFTLGSFKEYGNNRKHSLDGFINEFITIFNNI